MDIGRLKSDELTHELIIRGCDIPRRVDDKRSELRNAIRQESLGLLIRPAVYFEPVKELEVCYNKLSEILLEIERYDRSNASNEFRRINSRLLHIEGRLDRVNPNSGETISKKNEMLILLRESLRALNKVFSESRQHQPLSGHETSILDQPNPPLPEPDLAFGGTPVNNLLNLGDSSDSGESLDEPEDMSEQPRHAAVLTSHANNNNNSRASDLLRRLSKISLQSHGANIRDSSNRDDFSETSWSCRATNNSRRLSFRNPEVSHIGGSNRYGEPGNSYSVNRDPPFNNTFQDLRSDPNNFQYDDSRRYVPITKWNLFFDGSASVTTFIEDVEELAEARGVSKQQMFQSASEFFKGDALLWFRPRKHKFADWEDLKRNLRSAFLPLDYELNLMDDIRRRTQGPEEKLIMYVSRMQNLFNKLTNKPSELEQVNVIKRNLLPYLHTTLALQELTTIDDLLRLGLVVEDSHRRAQQYCPPPSNPRLLQEPSLAYRRPIHQKQETLRAIEVEQQVAPRMDGSAQTGYRPARTTPAKPLVCWNCSQTGHRRADCTQPVKVQCYVCRTPGYTKRNCPVCSGNEPRSH